MLSLLISADCVLFFIIIPLLFLEQLSRNVHVPRQSCHFHLFFALRRIPGGGGGKGWYFFFSVNSAVFL
jgi:hypothetical protein